MEVIKEKTGLKGDLDFKKVTERQLISLTVQSNKSE